MTRCLPFPDDDDFDYVEGQRLKKEGMERAAKNRAEALLRARKIAVAIGRTGCGVHADMVASLYYRRYGVRMADDLGNSAGSIFKGGEWVFTGDRTTSARKKNHGRELKIWKLT